MVRTKVPIALKQHGETNLGFLTTGTAFWCIVAPSSNTIYVIFVEYMKMAMN